MTKSKADFVIVPVGTPLPREQVEARVARLEEIIPQYEAMEESTKAVRGDDDAAKVRAKVKEFKVKLAEYQELLKTPQH